MEKDELEKLVASSKSLSEVLRKQNKAVSGDSMKLLKKTLDSFDIKYQHLSFNEIRKNHTLDEILNNEAPCQSSKLKKRLIEANLKQDVCEICGQTNVWKGQALTLQLDHINGDHYDNRLENLRIICPNCHSQTNTFSRKREKNVNFCIDCGAPITSESKYCTKCSPKHKRTDINKPSKEELLKLIQVKSWVEIGEQFNMRESSIRKLCKKYGIPSSKKEMREGVKETITNNNNLTKPSREELLNLLLTENFTSIGRIYNVSDNAVRKWCKKYNIPNDFNSIKEYRKNNKLF